MKIGFIGAGNMARAIIVGLIKQGVCQADELACISGEGPTGANLSKETGIRLASSREELIANSDITLLAFKPHHLDTISTEEGAAAEGKVILSVLAGRTIESIQARFPSAQNIVRVMPNTPARIGRGICGFCFANDPTPKLTETVSTILGALGSSYAVDESQMHIVTALSGSGPALFFKLIDILSEAAAKQGLPKEEAIKAAIATGIGALELMKQSDQTPQALADEVTSPNGTTFALLASLAEQNWSSVFENALNASVNRSIELSQS